MSEYDTWFELWGFDGVRWEFVTDFDTREDAELYQPVEELGYEQTRIRKCKGVAS